MSTQIDVRAAITFEQGKMERDSVILAITSPTLSDDSTYQEHIYLTSQEAAKLVNDLKGVLNFFDSVMQREMLDDSQVSD